jgi:hypothetical protein
MSAEEDTGFIHGIQDPEESLAGLQCTVIHSPDAPVEADGPCYFTGCRADLLEYSINEELSRH